MNFSILISKDEISIFVFLLKKRDLIRFEDITLERIHSIYFITAFIWLYAS